MNQFTRLLFACLLAILTGVPPAFAIKGGRASHDAAGLRRAVVQIKGPGGTQCSGTIISRRLVLTAAHCFLAGRGEYRIRVLDPKFDFRYAVADIVAIHPDFDVRALGTNAPLNDIALLRSNRDFPAWLTPVAMSAITPDDGEFVDVLAAGFGMSRNRSIATAGTLRQQHFAMLDQIHESTRLLFLIDRKSSGAHVRSGICRGDSGGPVFRRSGSGYVLAGVISAVVAGENIDCGAITAVTPVSAYRSFIQEMAGRANSPVTFR